MKKQIKKLWKKYWIPVMAVLVLILVVTGLLIYSEAESQDHSVKVAVETDRTDNERIEEPKTIEQEVEENVSVEEAEPETEDSSEKEEVATNDNEIDSKSTITETKTPVATNDTTETTKPAISTPTAPVAPIPESTTPETEPTTPEPTPVTPEPSTPVTPAKGWAVYNQGTYPGNLTAEQLNTINGWVDAWARNKTLTTNQLEKNLREYLTAQNITFDGGLDIDEPNSHIVWKPDMVNMGKCYEWSVYEFYGIYSTGEAGTSGTLVDKWRVIIWLS